jgi:hypothetical protein
MTLLSTASGRDPLLHHKPHFSLLSLIFTHTHFLSLSLSLSLSLRHTADAAPPAALVAGLAAALAPSLCGTPACLASLKPVLRP